MEKMPKEQALWFLEINEEKALTPQEREQIAQDTEYAEMWELHCQALRLGEALRTEREAASASETSQGRYLVRLRERRAAKEALAQRAAFWGGWTQIAKAATTIAAMVGLLWFLPQQLTHEMPPPPRMPKGLLPQAAPKIAQPTAAQNNETPQKTSSIHPEKTAQQQGLAKQEAAISAENAHQEEGWFGFAYPLGDTEERDEMEKDEPAAILASVDLRDMEPISSSMPEHLERLSLLDTDE
jgi:hypothetical protein